jgi:serine/threonine protein kinase
VEQAQGLSLKEIVASYRQRTELPTYILAIDWFEQAFRALAAIHAGGRVHRSIGLEKVIIGDNDELLIDESVAAGGTGEGSCAAPEQIAGRAVDQRADLYSLGAAFYELLTLRRPVAMPDPPSSVNGTVPKGFDRMLLRLLEAVPEDRYASADDVLTELHALRQSRDSAAAPLFVTAAGQPNRPLGVPRAAMIAAGATIGALGGAAAGWFLNSLTPSILVGAVVGGVVGVFSNSNIS